MCDQRQRTVFDLGCDAVDQRCFALVFPKEEFIRNGENGMLVDFFDGDALVDTACTLLEDRMPAARLGAAARQTAVEQYDLATVCLPRQPAWLDEVACA